MINKFIYTAEDLNFIFRTGEKYIQPDCKIYNVTHDSREVKDGSLFVAIKGDHLNGHNFIESAIQSGAKCILCEYIPKKVYNFFENKHCSFIIVPNSYLAFIQFAKLRRSSLSAKVIAITGSIGKSTTKEALSKVLSSFFKVFKSPKSYNGKIGVCYSILNAPLDIDLLILELGISMPDEMLFLTDIAKPDIAIITTIAPTHTQFFSNVEDIARNKIQIAKGLNPDTGILILNQVNKYYDMLYSEAKNTYGIKHIYTIGDPEKSHVYVSEYHFTNFFKTEYKINIKTNEKIETIKSTVNGLSYHSAFNTLFIFLIAKLSKLDLAKIANDIIPNIEAFEGRGNIEKILTEKKEILLINDSYNSSPEALRAALDSLYILQGQNPEYQSIAILGDMLELGEKSLEYHLEIVDQILAKKINKLITVGPKMKIVSEKLAKHIEVAHYEETRFLVKNIRKHINLKCIMLFKASRGFKFEVAINKLYR